MGEVGPITYFTEQALLWLAATVMGEDDHNIFHRASITTVGWHCYGPITYFTELALLWLAGTVMGEVGPITYFTEPALLWLAGIVMGEVGAGNIFHGAILLFLAVTVKCEVGAHKDRDKSRLLSPCVGNIDLDLSGSMLFATD